MTKKSIFFFFAAMLIYPIYGQSEITQESITRFMQAYVPSLMSKYDVAGLTMSLVYQGKTLYTAGFGMADVKNSIPVDLAQTLFRVGSISKLFVWTALMQLYEQGKLDLQADINTYLEEYALEKKFDEPVRILDLMAHTGGFEDNILGLFVKDPGQLLPFDTYMQTERLKRVIPPGRYIAYSNYGACLGVLIVEKITGQSFNDYVEEHILKPLAMQYSTCSQSLPADLANRMSTGYVTQAGKYIPQAFEFVNAAPAGALSSTAEDIAHFMLMHLARGRYLGQTLLRPETATLMQTASFEPVPGINGFAHGFIELGLPGLRIIGHGGDTIYFHSMCLLFPEQNLGLFYSTNSASGAAFNYDFFQKFLTSCSLRKQVLKIIKVIWPAIEKRKRCLLIYPDTSVLTV
jgi:CubicO group peptidase (beta-lactamase class C family)